MVCSSLSDQRSDLAERIKRRRIALLDGKRTSNRREDEDYEYIDVDQLNATRNQESTGKETSSMDGLADDLKILFSGSVQSREQLFKSIRENPELRAKANKMYFNSVLTRN